jgi:glyoxylase I family protein
MRTQGVHHVSFSVRDLERSRGFYEGVLGLETTERPDLGIPGVWYRTGGSEIHLIEHADAAGGPDKASPLANHCALSIADYDETVSELADRGVELVASIPASGQCWIVDPDGHLIELIAAR